ncbi:hypothetical protein GWI34_06365 [Actinomadura sp. DSM 109109]|nr:hypothetical protein [Actinomadura lepetitiana]
MDLGTAVDALVAVLGAASAALAYLEAREHRRRRAAGTDDGDREAGR